MVAAAPGTYSDDNGGGSMEFWPEFLATSGGSEFVAGGVGGMAGVLAGHPLDTLRIRLQQPPPPPAGGLAHAPRRRDTTAQPSAARLLRGILRAEGPSALYRGMAAPLASVAFQVSQLCSAPPRSPPFSLRLMPRLSGRPDHGFQDLGRRGLLRYVFLFCSFCLSPLITYFYFFSKSRSLSKITFLFAQKQARNRV